jgi:hypothetical protein
MQALDQENKKLPGRDILHLKDTNWREGHFTHRALTTETWNSKAPCFVKSCFAKYVHNGEALSTPSHAH